MEKSVMIAIAAVVISIVSISSSVALRPATLAPEVTTDELADRAVTGDKIAGNTITDANITTDGISRITAGAVGTDQIADNAVTAKKIAEGAIPEFAIGENEVTSAMIRDGTIGIVDIATADFDGRYVNEGQANSITSGMIANGSVTTDKIRENATTRVWGKSEYRTRETDSIDARNLITLTVETGENPVLVLFEGFFAADVFLGTTPGNENSRLWIWLAIDDTMIPSTDRCWDPPLVGECATVAAFGLTQLSAGTHTVQVKWCIDYYRPAGSFICTGRTLLVVELKR